MDLKKELWDKLTQLEEKKQGKADTYYDILALFNVVGQSEQLSCDTCKLKCDIWDDNHPCSTCCEFDNYQAS